MVPPSLKTKWPQDFAVFSDRCLAPEVAAQIRAASADSAVDFLKLVDDPEKRRKSIIFLTHGAMHRGLRDGWVKLAMLQRALYRRRNTAALRRSLCRCAGQLLGMGWVERRAPDVWERLLDTPSEAWLKVLHQYGIDPEGDNNPDTDDDPVPQSVIEALYEFDTTELFQLLDSIPQRQSAYYEDRVTSLRQALSSEIKAVWQRCLGQLSFKLPLLIMDEAHHLKNTEAQLSGLFRNPDARDDAELIARGPLGGVFERMLFLTATPFQLGHHELCSILDRFDGIAWESQAAPKCGRNAFSESLKELRERLDAAQQSAVILDEFWGQLREEDLVADNHAFSPDQAEAWWSALQSSTMRTPSAERLLAQYACTSKKMRAAEDSLRPWVIRHLKARTFAGKPRRERLPGCAILSDNSGGDEAGMEIPTEALLPFLLAARASACAPASRPVFAEGLASSYEAFLETRRTGCDATDEDDDVQPQDLASDGAGEWYLDHLEHALAKDGRQGSGAHPKIAATAKRVLAAWQQGEKVVVFCHYVRTGQVLRQVISGLIEEDINAQGAAKLNCTAEEASTELERVGTRFFDTESPLRKACDNEISNILQGFPELAKAGDSLFEVTRRYLRTPSFLARFFPLSRTGLDQSAVEAAFKSNDGSGLSLKDVLWRFFDFLEKRCVKVERDCYLEAIGRIQTGTIKGCDVRSTFSEDECQGMPSERLLPNVRLVNGAVKSETRQRLMRTFNSPFFPEILIASSVMAEGVDLHRFCRYVIHHDLCWNPSTLEQRTGRLDRIGGKVERCGQPIRVYLPYLSATQDEKQYRVVTDRERWFSVVMGEQFRVDARTTEKLARRVPLPASLAQGLAFRLEVAADRIGTSGPSRDLLPQL
jgi:hypothetical protein